nr:helix-turn-helix transcriptional regulator [uncultured Flavobacterium sp.]
MKRIINHRDFNVFKLEKTVWDIEYHNHNFYEIIIIEQGNGTHRLNNVSFPYKENDIFFLKPSDAHEFVIDEKTKFIYLKFTNQFIADLFLWNSGLRNKLNFDHLLLKTSNHFETFINNRDDAKHFKNLAEILYYEFVNFKSQSFEITFHLFSNLMLLLIRNISNSNKLVNSFKTNKIEQILSYITINALDADKMKISNLAKEFSMSENYISSYVKTQSGISVQHHIIQIKLKAAEKLLSKSSYNINEIADKLGFNDASHFNKFFKKYKGMSPTAFQKKI